MVNLYQRAGGEFLVNGQTANNQSGQHVARLPNGGFVVVWTDGSTVGDPDFGIRAQLFDSAGAKVGGEFLVNSTIAGTQSGARVAALPSGRFVVTWTDLSATGGDTSNSAVRGQLYEANGTPVGGEFLVNTAVTSAQSTPTVTGLAGGGFVIAWADSSGQGGDSSGSGIKAQLFDANGARVGGEFLVNTTTQNSQSSPSVVALAGGGFAIGWNETFSTGGQVVGAVRAQLFDSAGTKIGAELLANASSGGNFTGTSLAALPTGFLVTWAQQENQFSPAFDVRAQLYDAAGNKVGAEFVVNSTTEGSQTTPSAAALPGGGYIITWTGPGEGVAGLNVYGQVYDSAGAKVGIEFILSGVTDGSQSTPKVDVLASGAIVVTWTDSSGIGGDSQGAGIKAEILTLTSAAPSDIGLQAIAVSETAREDVGLVKLTTTGALNSSFTYQLLSDSSGGGFRIEGDKLVVDDHSRLDFETAPTVQLQIRSTDLNGNSFTETISVAIGDTPEAGYVAGDQYLVNTTTAGNQTESQVTWLASGGFVVTWIDWNLGGRAQIHDSDGNKVGPELAVNGALAPLPGGGFVAAGPASAGDGSFGGIALRFYDSSGSPTSGEIPVNSTTAGDQYGATVATLESGGFVVTWTDRPPGFQPGTFGPTDVRAQRFDSNGVKVGAEFLVNNSTPGDQGGQQIAALETGGFVITWFDSFFGGLRGQIFDSNGLRLSVDFRIETSSPAPAEQRIAALPGGGFVIVWSKNFSSGGFTGVGELTAQLFDAQGVRIGTEILIAANGPAQVSSFDVDALDWGGFVVTWNEDSSQGPQILAQTFDPTGGRVGDLLAVNQAGGGDIQASISGLPSGGFVIAWTDPAGDGNGFGIQARLFEPDSAITGTGGDDVLNGTPGADRIFGQGGNDVLNGLAGNDLLDGGSGNDMLNGGDGNDVYVVDSAADVVTENAGEGTDEVRTTLASYLLGANVEKLTGTSGAGQSLTGNALDNVIAGGAGADTMAGGLGNDIYLVGAGDEVSEIAGEGTDEVRTSLSTYALGANVENLTGTSGSGQSLTGNAASNVITGGSGDDVIDGGAGNDVMAGGLGNDLYFVDSAADVVADTGGTDEIRTGLASYTLAAAIENLTGTSSLGQVLTGNLGSNVIRGGSGDDTLVGDGGDTLIGGLGNDIYVNPHGNALFTVENPGEGVDEVRTSASVWILADNFENLTGTSSSFQALHGNGANNVVRSGTGGADLYGEGGDDILIGTAANEQFRGGEGSDLMTGGGGNDFYIDVGAGDQVVEAAGGGADWLTTSLASYVLPDNVETLEGRASSAQMLTGNAQANRIIGTDYNDVLDGGAGDDTLEGGFGDDVYVVDSLGDVVTDFFGDNDEVRTGLSAYTLAANIERLTGTSVLGQSLTGNGGANVIVGGSGNDVLAGAGGADQLSGGAGDDIYYVDGADTVTELAGGGSDEIRTDLASYSIAGTANVENLTGLGSGDQSLTGNGLNNVINGGAGADTMTGGLGNDFYYVDSGSDAVVELAGEGTDTIGTSLAFYDIRALPQVENLIAVTDNGHSFVGNSGNNLLSGAAGNDTLNLRDGGNDSVNGGAGNDVIHFGATLTAADSVDGGTGIDQVVLQGNYAALSIGSSFVSIESLAILPGSDLRFGDPGGSFYSYNLGMNDANVAAGATMVVDANRLRAGENLQFDGSAEHDGAFFIYGGGGTDALLGGLGNDTFYFGENGQFGATDRVHGGAGGTDQLGLRGNYTIVFGADQLTSIESLGLVSAQDTRFGALGTSYNYNLTMNDGNLAAGVRMTVDAAPLRGSETLTFDGSAELDGSFRIFGGQGADTIKGSQGNDLITGGTGADSLSGGGGADTFIYRTVADSTATAHDTIHDFAGGDIINLSQIDAIAGGANDAFTFIGSNAFSGTAGELRAVFENNAWTVQGDVNGDGVADIEMIVVSDHPLAGGDFAL